MKFSFKILLCMLMVMALALGFSGYYFVNHVFESSLEREIGQSLDESSILGFALETAALNVPSKYRILPDHTIDEIAAKLEAGGAQGKRLLRISDEEKNVLYSSDGFDADGELLASTDKSIKSYHITAVSDQHYIHTVTAVTALNRVLYLETLRSVSDVFTARALGFSLYRRVTVLMLLAGALMMHLICSVLTKPIRILTQATRKMEERDYSYRAKQVSQDELGQLTQDFNHMAETLEQNIEKLEEEIDAKEEFMGAFAHELKTPLTTIIGYADLLRSKKLDTEKHLMAANYIYTEGRRLEAMSLRLLEIIVAGKKEAKLSFIPAELIFDYLTELYADRTDLTCIFQYEKGNVLAELNLLKTVLINLIDNAAKASEPDSAIEIKGFQTKNGYRFCVKDHGIGIPEDELHKIAKAFYMVDKSRSRQNNGAGLGLALCTQILSIHGSSLLIESEPGKGSCFSFLLKNTEET